MCGIVGCSFDESEAVGRGLRHIAHRGPDGSRVLRSGRATLGAVRLAIMDRSRKALQPMSSDDGQVWLALNGEVYNSPELRQALERAGRTFETGCDTEAVLHAYLEWGERCFALLEGMFSLSVVDNRTGAIHLVRDPMGIKPLYYALLRTPRREEIIFGSEIKALLPFQGLSRELDRTALAEYFAFRYVPGERTLLRQVRRLLPGDHLRFVPGAAPRFESIRFEAGALQGGRPEESLRNALSDAVRRCLRGDVPVGLYLSGGLDSSILAALMADNSDGGKGLHSFSISLSPNNDEGKAAEAVAEEFGLTHHAVEFDEGDEGMLARVAWHQDDLVSDPVLLANYQLAEYAERHATVVLAGEGADELFGGYAHYVGLEHLPAILRLPLPLRRIASSAVSRIPVRFLDSSFSYPASVGRCGRRRAAAMLLSDSAESAYFSFVQQFDEGDEDWPMVDKGMHAAVVGPWREALAGQPGRTLTERAMRYEQQEWLPHYILNKLDRMTMCSSLEGRVPYLLPGVVELARTLPLKERIHWGMTKVLLRRAFGGMLPRRIASRRKYPLFVKGGRDFEHALADVGKARMDDLAWPNCLDKGACQQVLDHMDGSLLRQRQAFGVVMISLWLDQLSTL